VAAGYQATGGSGGFTTGDIGGQPAANSELDCAEMVPFEPSHFTPNGLKSYFRSSRAFSRIAANPFQNPAGAFRHPYQCVGVVGEHARAKIENRQLWGLLWGPLIHLGESRHISNHLATTGEPVEPERVAGLSAFRSTSYLNRWKWSPEPSLTTSTTSRVLWVLFSTVHAHLHTG
jgi:hypothetical protein